MRLLCSLMLVALMATCGCNPPAAESQPSVTATEGEAQEGAHEHAEGSGEHADHEGHDHGDGHSHEEEAKSE